MKVADIESIQIKLASPDEILGWSHGEVTKPETINYRTQRTEKDGLFCEKTFGPTKDYECYCGKYRRVRYKGIICDKCGVEVTKSSVRRERMGHIKLAAPCSHIWFLRGVPSRMGMLLDIQMIQLERVIYFASYIITKVNEEAKSKTLEEIDREYKSKIKSQKSKIKNPAPKGRQKDPNKALTELKQLRDRAREEVLSLKLHKVISEIEYHQFSLKYGEIFEAGTGAETLRKIFEGIDSKKLIHQLEKEAEKSSPVTQKKILRRIKLLKTMIEAGVKPEWMFISVLPVLPPDLRPMVQLDGGRYASSDLNDLYRRVINRNNRLKYLLEISAPEVIVRNEKRMLQEAVDALIDNSMRKGQITTATTGGKRLLKSLADMLKGKQGRFRQNLLGKRVDYSGRSVIVVGPELRLGQCGIPKIMALELFKPFVIQKVLEAELAYNVRGASKLIEAKTEEIWAILEEVVANKLVLLNRAPTLHRLGIQAFRPTLIEGLAIRVHPLICKAFNADFDGDQMAVHLPLSNKAQKEAKEIMFSPLNLLKPATGTPIVSPSQDIVLGCYWLTKLKQGVAGEGKFFVSKNEAIMAYQAQTIDLRAKIKARIEGRFEQTSVGRILFNNALPDGYQFINKEMNGKSIEELFGDLVDKYDNSTVNNSLDKLKELGFEYSTISGISWGMDDLTVPKEKPKLIGQAQEKVNLINEYYKKGLLSKEEKASQTIEVWQNTKSEIEKLVKALFSADNPVNLIVSSGARGSWSQPVQMTGMKGLVINPAGQIIELPVKSSFKEGFSILEYFISTHGARKGTADTALRTSTAGYLTRRLVDVAHEVIVTNRDCFDKTGLIVSKDESNEIGQNFIFKIMGRTAVENVKSGRITMVKAGEIINLQQAREITAAEGVKEVFVRSPLCCRNTRGVCQKCYGFDTGSNKPIKIGEAVGIVAAQAIGEPGTQLTMRTFHTGGVAGGGDITQGLPRVEEIFEARIPGGKAVISLVDGKVEKITEDRVIKIKTKIPASAKPARPAGGALTGKAKSKKATEEIAEYMIPPKRVIWVKEGDMVKNGQQLCEGNVDLKELFRAIGIERLQKYIVQAIQKIYVSQGAVIHDKHIEVIVKQMVSRLRVRDAGDTRFSAGEILEKSIFTEENEKMKKAGKKPATSKPILLGISKVALTTDSFLSAASFQETSRVLIKAVLEGREDKLRGMKENVIIGKLIPAGTGFQGEKKE